MIQVIIQAGGKGSRLFPYTTVLPKPLMPVGENPILEIVIKQLVHYGFKKILITTGHLSHLIQAFFGDGSKWGAEITYQMEDKPLGTIGPIKIIKAPKSPFLVMNGDLLTDLDYDDLYETHLQTKADLTVACCKKEVQISLGIIEHNNDGRIVGFTEKPTLKYSVSMGIYVINPSLLSLIPKNIEFGFDQFIVNVIEHVKNVMVYKFDGLWLDIGRYEDYQLATKTFTEHRLKFLPVFKNNHIEET